MMAGKLSFVICNTRYVHFIITPAQYNKLGWPVGTKQQEKLELATTALVIHCCKDDLPCL